MRDFDQEPQPDKTLQLSMKWEASYRDLLDEIYYPGYSMQLVKEDPILYQKEYEPFIALYDGPQ